ncbi:MAG: hypothetical protein OXH16_07585 [Gemmatimonadetes bacterium]|nr:hypothetical protein [Gemmatimonadota bacterium]
MAKEEFEIAFHGPAVEGNSISARDLGTSMIALGDLLEYANKSLYGEGNKSVLRIKATREGSFEAVFEYAITAISDTTSFLNDNPMDVLQVLVGIPGATVSLFAIYRYLKGRQPEENEVSDGGDGKIHIEIEGSDNKIIVNKNTYNFYTDSNIRSAMRDLISPLGENGVERMDINQQENVESIDKSEIDFYDVPLREEEEKTESMQKIYVLVVSPSFQRGDKWRVSTGADETAFFVGIADNDFIDKVSRGDEGFKAGDSLYVELQTIQWIEDGQLKTERNIVKVIDHMHAGEQGNLEL